MNNSIDYYWLCAPFNCGKLPVTSAFNLQSNVAVFLPPEETNAIYL
jgi:hypothetical protein